MVDELEKMDCLWISQEEMKGWGEWKGDLMGELDKARGEVIMGEEAMAGNGAMVLGEEEEMGVLRRLDGVVLGDCEDGGANDDEEGDEEMGGVGIEMV